MKTIFYLVFLITCHSSLLSQDTKFSLLEKYCDAKYKTKNFNGNILVAQKGRVLFQKSYGYDDLRKKTPLSSKSVFNICSITKEFTAAAIMFLKEKGLLSLDDSLRKFFPELPYYNISLRQMLNHTSGIVSSEFTFKEWNIEREITAQDMYELLKDKKPALLFTHGEKFEYSNTPYVLLALIVEKLTNQTYPAFIKENIFDKLGMTNSWVRVPGKKNKTETENYIYDYTSDSAKTKTYFLAKERADWKKAIFVSSLYGSGNIYSTASDLLKWQEALNNNKFISKESYQDMRESTVSAGVLGIEKYGYGLSINTVYGDTMIFHNGGTLGYSTTLRHFKNKDFTIITLANTSRNNDPVEGIVAILYDQKVELPTLNKEVKLAQSDLEFFTGTYQLGDRQFTIELNKDTLFRMVPNTPPLRLIPKSKTQLYYADDSDRDLIVKKESGKLVVKLVKADGMTVDLEKIK